jgi:HAD superfamily hydrolase (TIGR01484 family)
MQPLETLSPNEARGLAGVLFDLDDTLLDHGELTEDAYSALFRLREAGLVLVGVTGRPAGWAEVLVRQWPVRAMVAENGAIAFGRQGSTLERWDSVDESTRRARRQRLVELVTQIKEAFPELVPADDVEARVSDFTFDIGEHARVSDELVERVASFARERGARPLRSSVHLHVGFDTDDKASGVLRLLKDALGECEREARLRYAYVGDSENDERCFAEFQTTIAVSNLRGRLTAPPRFITRAAMGAGFAEAARVLVARRRVYRES